MSTLNQFRGGVFNNREVYSTVGTFAFTVPLGVYACYVFLVGGGGGGAGGHTSTTEAAGGGQGGELMQGWVPVTPGQEISITVAATAAGGAANNPGTIGNWTLFGDLLRARGGLGGYTPGTAGQDAAAHTIYEGSYSCGFGGKGGASTKGAGSSAYAGAYDGGAAGADAGSYVGGSGGGAGWRGNGGAGGNANNGGAGVAGAAAAANSGAGGGGGGNGVTGGAGGAGGSGYALVCW